MSIPTFTRRQILLIVAPPILLATTYAAYYFLAKWMGLQRGYLGGFLFYWIIWCLLIPLWSVGPGGLRRMFKDTRPRFGKHTWLVVFLLVVPFLVSFIMYFLPKVKELNGTITLVSVLFAIINGTMEEVLWRGTYVTAFPNNWFWSYWYSSICFGYWHLSPQVVNPSQMPGGAFAFATMSIFLGLVYGWVAKRTGSIRWTVISHILADFFGLAGMEFLKLG